MILDFIRIPRRRFVPVGLWYHKNANHMMPGGRPPPFR